MTFSEGTCPLPKLSKKGEKINSALAHYCLGPIGPSIALIIGRKRR